MQLKRFQVTEFRSVWDSNPVSVEDVTCLVGKNESGKTTLLKALYRINPYLEQDADFDPTDDYPRKEAGDYLHEVEAGSRQPATVVSAFFELSPEDIAVVEEAFGKKALQSNTLQLKKGYSNQRTYELDFNEQEAIRYVVSAADLTSPTQKILETATSWSSLQTKLVEVEETEGVQTIKELATKVGGKGGSYYTFNQLLSQRVPKFLYFDEYYQMVGHENVQALIKRKADGALLPSDYPMLGLINLARINLEDLLNVQRTMELVNKLEGAGNHLTRQVLQYWSQNKHLQMKFDVREARPEDPENMQSGQNIWGRVYDSVHWATTELGSRSKGFVWFFSFLAWYEDVKLSGERLVLLLDEPGLSLHGRAQADLLKYIEEQLKPHHQVMYTTHSPFMVDSKNFDRVRIVQDRGVDADDPLPKKEDGTKVLTDVFDATDDSLFPLQGALGYDINQTLFVGPNSLIVEGPADMLYLQGMSSVLERDGMEFLDPRWIITPVGGSSKVPTFVSLLGSQKNMNIAVLVDVATNDKESVENLYKKKLLNKKNVHTFGDFVGSSEADVEDMFDRKFYIEIVNKEYEKELSKKITMPAVNAKIPRVTKAIDDFLSNTPLKFGQFGHFRPSRYFAENLSALTPKISNDCKNRFELAFKKLNALLG